MDKFCASILQNILAGDATNKSWVTCYDIDDILLEADNCFYNASKSVEMVARFSIITGGGTILLLLVAILILLIITCFLRYKNKKLRR